MVREIQLIGFNFTKISGERYSDFKENLKINPNINISSIDKHDLNLIKQDAIKVVFSFSVKYEDLADIALEGNILLRVDTKTQKDLINGWTKKNLDKDLQTIIVNLIMQKASIRAIELEEEMNLPIHIKIPKLEISKEN